MKTFKIIALGPSGSGKTVFLASMFKALGIQAEQGFYLHVDDTRQRKMLNTIYTEIIIGEFWPRGTRYSEVSEWHFVCRVKNPDLDYYDACKFIYYDYAGGRLTDQELKDDDELQQIISESDALLVLIDGQKVLSLMAEQHPLDVERFLNKDLPSIMVPVMNSEAPIHFVVTKYDLLEPIYSFEEVASTLINLPLINMVVREKTKSGTILRLIPVSSVGSHFAELQTDGSMKKFQEKLPFPYNVEVPICCVLPDGMRTRLRELSQQIRQLESQGIQHQNVLWNIINKTGPFINFAWSFGLDMLLPEELFFAKPLLDKIDNFIIEGARQLNMGSLNQLRAERDGSLVVVKDEATALSHAIDCFRYVQDRLEYDFPSSVLGNRIEDGQ